MNDLWQAARIDIAESLRSRWFTAYSVIFGGLVIALIISGVSESRIMGFTGLSRLLVIYLQITMAVLPLFVLITTVRSIAGDREAGVFEYMLSLPISLFGWYWGKLLGRFIIVFAPVLLALGLAVIWGAYQGTVLPWVQIGFYTAFLFSLSACFLGLGMLLSSLTRSSEVATASAFILWLLLLLFLDLILLGVLIRQGLPPETVVSIALLNPLQVFRTGAMLLFDPQLVMLGPSAYLILDHFGRIGYLIWTIIYPFSLGLGSAYIGYLIFKRGDLI